MTQNARSRVNRSTLLRAAGTLLALLLLVFLLSQQGWDEILAAVRSIPLWRLLLALGLMMGSRFAVSARWHVLLRSADMPVSFGQSVRITFAGLFASNFLPTTIGGDVVRLGGAVQLKFDAAVSAASLIADRLVGMAGMAMVIPFGLPRFLQQIGAASSLLQSGLFLHAGFTSLPGSRWFNKAWVKGQRILQKILAALSLWLKRPRALLAAMLFSWIHMICLFLVITQLFAGMNQHISFWLTGGLYAIVYFITLLPISINGYGLQEVSMTFIFTNLAGAAMGTGLAAALLFRTLMMIASLPGAAFVPAMLSSRQPQVEK
jgi:glycosyltransferase 2 family protein